MKWSDMEDLKFSLVLPLIIIVAAFLIKKNINDKKTRRPPGPWKLPLIGNLHNLVGSLPHHVLRDLSNKYGPLILLRLGTVPTLVVSSAELAEEFLKTHGNNFTDRPHSLASELLAYKSKDIIFTPHGDKWRQMRKVCATEVLSTKRVQSFGSIRQEEISILLQSISSSAVSGSAVDLTELLFLLTLAVITRASFGGKWVVRPEELRSQFCQLSELFSGFTIADMYPSMKFLHGIGGFRKRAEKVHQKMDYTLTNIIMTHREKNATTSAGGLNQDVNLVDVLLRVQKEAAGSESPLTDDFIKAVIFDVFFGGSETSSTTMDWAMSELVKNPRSMERAQAEVRQVFDGRGYMDEKGLEELKYFHCIIKETLRFHPPALIPRENRQECVINGYVIPPKSRVLINTWAIGRDPRYWGPDAHLFKPERFLDTSIAYDYKGTFSEFIPFGAGKRICPGMTFGLASIELPLAQLLYHFDWKLPEGLTREEIDMTEVFGVNVRRKTHLNLIPVLRG